MRRTLVAILLGVALWPTPAQALTLEPVADSMVRFDQPSANFGSSTIIRAGYSHKKEVRTFARFSLPSGTTGTATLRIHVQRGNGGKARVYLVSNDTWAEGGITWNNQPAIGQQVATFQASPGWHSVTVPVSGGLNSFAFRKFEGPADPGPTSSVGRDEVSKWSSSESSRGPVLVL